MKKVLIGLVIIFGLGIFLVPHILFSLGYGFLLEDCKDRVCLLTVVPAEKVLTSEPATSTEEVSVADLRMQVPLDGTLEQLETGVTTIRYSDEKVIIVGDLILPALPEDESIVFPRSAPVASPYEYLTAIYNTLPEDFNHFSSLEQKQIMASRLVLKNIFVVTDQIYRIETDTLRGYMTVNERLTNVDVEVAGKGYSLSFIGFTDEERDAVLLSIEG